MGEVQVLLIAGLSISDTNQFMPVVPPLGHQIDQNCSHTFPNALTGPLWVGDIEGPSLGTDIPAGSVKKPIPPPLPMLGAEKEILLPVAARGTSGPARSHPRERRQQELRTSCEQWAWRIPGLHLLSVGSKSREEGA